MTADTGVPAKLKARLAGAASHDFAPVFSAKARRFLYTPLGVLAAAGAASLLCGLFLHAQGFVLAGGVLAVAALGVVWPWLTGRGVGASLAFDRDRVCEGEPVGVALTLRNRLPWAARGLAVGGGFGGGAEAVAGVVVVPRRRVALCRWQFTPAARGVYPLAAVRVTTGFPFGLWNAGRSIAVASRLTVWPKTYPVGPVPPSVGNRQVEGSVSRGKVGTTGDVVGVRPYRRGDSPRRIHWGQSARQDRLIVCEVQSNTRPVIQIVVDLDPHSHAGAGPDSSREWAIRVAASFARGWLEDGARVGLAGGMCDIAPNSGPAQLRAVLDELASAADSPRPLTEVLACPRCQKFRDGLQVVIATDRSRGRVDCEAREAENRRWVVLPTAAFGGAREDLDGGGATPWLALDSIEAVPGRLLGGWREARHGS